MATMNISLPDQMREFVEAQVKSGRYANASDYMRDLIRHNQQEREWLRQAILEGEMSGVAEGTLDEIFEDIMREESDA